MCLILFAWQVHPKYPLVLVANRDEFYARPTAPADFWEEKPQLLAGRDLQAGGTWMGITGTGRFSAITNYRDPQNIKSEAPSRGMLTTNYLTNDWQPEGYLQKLQTENLAYNGYNLLVGNLSGLWYFNNVEREIVSIPKGIHGLSNAFLNSNWPKTDGGKMELGQIITKENLSLDELMGIMLDKTKAPDSSLPATGVPYEWEKVLSSRYIESPTYGTTITTVMTIGTDGEVKFLENTHAREGQVEVLRSYDFNIGQKIKVQI